MNEKLKVFFQELDKLGCTNHYCWIIGPSVGQHTNSRCHCLDSVSDIGCRQKIRSAFMLFQKEIYRLNLELKENNP